MGAAGLEVFCEVIILLFCFDGETEVTVKGKERSYKKPISEVEKGEYVLTYNGNDLIYSKVKENKKQESERTFFTFKVKDQKSNIRSISVTDNHFIIVYNKETNEPVFKNASEIKVGEITRTVDGLGEIVEITQDTKENCYKFVVEQGTVLANDILVGAFYSQNDDKKLKEDILKTTKISVPSMN
jgi:hypothetical protein